MVLSFLDAYRWPLASTRRPKGRRSAPIGQHLMDLFTQPTGIRAKHKGAYNMMCRAEQAQTYSPPFPRRQPVPLRHVNPQ